MVNISRDAVSAAQRRLCATGQRDARESFNFSGRIARWAYALKRKKRRFA
jgi:hypothetical protein